MSDRTCGTDGCERKRHARGLCASCYAKQYKAKRATTRECAHCAELFDTYNEQTQCCSDTCAQRHRFGWDMPSTCTDLIPYAPPAQPARKPRAKGRWFACECTICGDKFIAPGFHYTCSSSCSEEHGRRKMREHRIRRHIARGRFAVPDEFRLGIYERDGWTCQLCGKPTSRTYHYADPDSPTLDHIIPQSHTPIPDHGARNLRLAHALCNSLRGDQVEGQEVLAHGMAHL